jgi:uncharacterized membrane protein YhaH (DUF805 family)
MAEARYKIIFDGMTVIETPEATVKTNLAQLFKCDLSRIEPLFNGQVSTLKRGLSESEAKAYAQALRNAGAIVRMEREEAAKPAPTIAAAPLSLVEEPDIDNKPAERDETGTAFPAQKAGQESEQPPHRIGASARSSQDNAQPAYKSPSQALAESDHYCELNFFSLEGRLGRMRFMAWGAGMVLLAIPVALLTLVFNTLGLLVFYAYSIAALVFTIAFTVRRLHDMDKSGWWLFFLIVFGISMGIIGAKSASLTPILLVYGATLLFSLFLCLKAGDTGTNAYGLPPPPNSGGVLILGGLYIFLNAIGHIGNVVQYKELKAEFQRYSAAKEGNADELLRQLDEQLEKDPEHQRRMRDDPNYRRYIEQMKEQMKQQMEKQNR